MNRNNLKKWFFVFAVIIFATGIVLTIYNLSTKKTGEEKAEVPLVKNDSLARPEFEIGYLIIPIHSFKSILSSDSINNTAIIAPVFSNEITKRIINNVPLIAPDYSKMPLEYYDIAGLKAFIKLYKQHKVHLSETFVACLFIKQKGSSDALKTTLSFNKAVLSVHEMYDGTDINSIIYKVFDSTQMSADGFLKKYDSASTYFDTMPAGASMLVPLYVMNYFRPVDINSRDEEAYKQVTDGTIFIPEKLTYNSSRGDTTQLMLDKFLMNPLVLEE